MAPTSFEEQLRTRVDEAFASTDTGGRVADVAVSRGRTRVQRRRATAVASVVVALVSVTVGAPMLVPRGPAIAPIAPGEGDDGDGASDADERVAAEEAERARMEAERARVEAERERMEERVRDEQREAAEAERLLRGSEPVTGYGDFSDVDPFELDTYAVMLALGRCVAAGGFDVSLAAPGDGLDYHDDGERNRAAQQREMACLAGLRLPDHVAPTAEQRRIGHAYQVAVHACLIGLGYDLPPAPAEPPTYGAGGEPQPDAWAPYTDLVDRYPEVLRPAAWDEVQSACPRGPVGGFGAWSPGDPVRSVDELPTLD